jgi:2-polyprenyl-3-methyl-5-hydroxy-6-metoxy-1,4-benzoquinol methylase
MCASRAVRGEKVCQCWGFAAIAGAQNRGFWRVYNGWPAETAGQERMTSMATPSQGPRPTPERIFNTLTAFQQTEALKAAIELDIFTKIGEGATEVSALAKRVGASERGVRILCDYMTIFGFLTKDQNRYALTQESAIFLDRRSPACVASMSDFLASERARETFALLTQTVRDGRTAADTGDHTEPCDEMWVNFAKSMAPLTARSASFIAQLIEATDQKPCKVLDIAASHGVFGITIAKQNPNAQIVALDWPAVLEVAKQNAQAAGLGGRHTTLPGSAFEVDFGHDYDYVLVTNLFHSFDAQACESLMRKAHAALKPGGRVITLEFVPNDDRVSPPTPASFSLMMLANTDAGDAYTFSEFDKMFRNAGFAKTTLHPVPEMPQQVLVSEK